MLEIEEDIEEKPMAFVTEQTVVARKKLKEYKPPNGHRVVAGPKSAIIMNADDSNPYEVNFIIVQKI